MNKKFIIKKNKDIQNIIKCNNKLVNDYYIIYYINNDKGFNRFCVSVSKKIGKANVRNLLKRKIKDILMKNFISSSNDYVIILRSNILNLSYINMKDELLSILKGDIK